MDADSNVKNERLDDLRRKAERVIAGTQTGQYLKRDLARDLLSVLDWLDERLQVDRVLDAERIDEILDLQARLASVYEQSQGKP